MASANRAVQPVKALEETATALEAAVLECLAKPRTKSVHKVRTTTRRMEAQLTLLTLVGGFPAHKEQEKKMRKLLKKLRRAAGAVRDVDVQEELVAKDGPGRANGAGTGKAGTGKAGIGKAGIGKDKESRKLLRHLKKRRDKEADKLEGLLHAVHAKLPSRVKALMDALEPAEERGVTEAELITMVRGWYSDQASRFKDAGGSNPDGLHGIRKVAKLARYLAETAPDGARRAHALAEKFESIQESGGQWHDWLILAEVAASELGDSAALPQRFGTRAGEALAEFEKKLGYEM